MRAILVQLPDDYETVVDNIETVTLRRGIDPTTWRCEAQTDAGSTYLCEVAEVEVGAGMRELVAGVRTTVQVTP